MIRHEAMQPYLELRKQQAMNFYQAGEHPQVDWQVMGRNRRGQLTVQVTCPVCNVPRFCNAYDVARRIREGAFTGRCAADHVTGVIRKTNKIGRPPHPCVNWETIQALPVGNGHRASHVQVTCPICNEQRWNQINHTARAIHKGTFTGNCIKCGSSAKKRDWLILGPGRKIEPAKGYVRLSRHAVPLEDQWLWDGLRRQRGGSCIMEHRFVMSKMLGRPVTTNELVDHMDGDKTNNDPSNLRLYRRGKNDPGDMSGFGTFYHEWQMALSEIERLKAPISSA